MINDRPARATQAITISRTLSQIIIIISLVLPSPLSLSSSSLALSLSGLTTQCHLHGFCSLLGCHSH